MVLSKITCKVCQDLLPLVQDSIASDDSRLLVEKHIQSCSTCSELYSNNDLPVMNDENIMKDLKNKIRNSVLLMLILATVFGASITESHLVFYNIVLMPVIGGVAYVYLKNKIYYALGFIFSIVFVNHLTTILKTGEYEYFFSMFLNSIFMSLIYVFLSLIGVVVVILLQYGFKRED